MNFAPPRSLWYRQPAGTNWTHALPIGCGKLGAMIFGNVAKERIQLNEDSLWNGGPRDRNNPDTLENLSAIRELLQAGKLSEANALTNDAMAGIPDSMRCYEPLADLLIEFSHLGVTTSLSAEDQNNAGSNVAALFDENLVQDYHRKLDLETAVASVNYEIHGNRFLREHLASFPENCIILRFTAEAPGSLFLSLRMERGPRDSYSSRYCDASEQVGTHGLLIHGAAGGEQGVHFASCLRSQVEGGSSQLIGETLRVENAHSVTLVIAAATSFRTSDPTAYALTRSEEALRKSWSQLLAEHIADYSSLFSRVKLELSSSQEAGLVPTDEASLLLNAEAGLLPTNERLHLLHQGHADPDLAALYFDYGRYLLISSSRPGSLPANLQGIWNEDFMPAFGSKYTININLQMNYWAAEAGNLAECHEPLFELIHRLVESGRSTAKKMYDCRGFVAHHNTDLWADSCPTDRNLAASYWLMGGAWLALHLWEHYAFSHDLNFLRRAYPVLHEASLFFFDFLIANERGELIVVPSSSPENVYRLPNSEVGVLCAGTAMDSSILTMLFHRAKQAAELLRCDEEFCSELTTLITKLPRPSIDSNGRLMEWMEEYEEIDLQHRHISHGFALYPGDQISLRSTPDLARAMENTLLTRGDNGTGWCMAWKSCFWARLGNGNKAHALLLKLLQPVEHDPTMHKTSVYEGGGSYRNLFCAHPPFQIDGNFGGTAAILEMLLQSHESIDGLPIIHLLPALPAAWPTGSVSGLRARGGYAVSIRWNHGRLSEATITATESSFLFVAYNDLTQKIEMHKGMTLRFNSELESVIL